MSVNAVKEDAREVPAELNELTVMVQRLAETVDKIGLVLQPVISKNPALDPTANAPDERKEPQTLCDTAQSIRGNKDRILDTILTLQDLSNEVEL